MSDFGEPWVICPHIVRDRNGHDMRINRAERRIVACVNALAGIADPAAQVERWKAMEAMLRRYEVGRDPMGLFSRLSSRDIAALAAEWTENE